MKNLFYCLALIFSANLYGSAFRCMEKDIDSYMQEVSANGKVFKTSKYQHVLAFPEDSCGSRGCEVFVFTEVLPGCVVESLNVKGFYLKGGLGMSRLRLKVDGKKRDYRFSRSLGRFH